MRWTYEDKQKVYDLYINQNKEAKEIAEIFGCTTKVIRSILYREGWTKYSKVEINKDDIYDLYITQNLSQKEVAQKLGINEGTLKRKLWELGIKKDSAAHVENIRKACMEKYGLPNGGWAPETQKKIKATNLERYGSESYLQCDDYKKKNKTTLEKMGVENVFQLEEIKEKSKQTMLERYGVEYSMQNPEVAKKAGEAISKTWMNKTNEEKSIIKEKISNSVRKTWANKSEEERLSLKKRIFETKIANGTVHTSKSEQEIKKLLEQKFPDTKSQYMSDKYSFPCDFYIPCLNLYIEYQGLWIHGFKPFEGTKEDLEKVEKWRLLSEHSDFYKAAIKTWTETDVLKRETAKKNNLNFLEFFTFNEFMEWYEQL